MIFGYVWRRNENVRSSGGGVGDIVGSSVGVTVGPAVVGAAVGAAASVCVWSEPQIYTRTTSGTHPVPSSPNTLQKSSAGSRYSGLSRQAPVS